MHCNLLGQIVSGSERYPVDVTSVALAEVENALNGARVIVVPDDESLVELHCAIKTSAVTINTVEKTMRALLSEKQRLWDPSLMVEVREPRSNVGQAFATGQRLFSIVRQGTEGMRESLPSKLIEATPR